MSTKYEPVFEIGDVDEYLNQMDVMVNDFSTLGGMSNQIWRSQARTHRLIVKKLFE